MPAYVAGTAVALYPGDLAVKLFSAETVATASKSLAFAKAANTVGAPGTPTFEIDFASAPTATVTIEGANIDLDADYQILYTSISVQHDNYTDNANWAFYRAHVTSYSAGGALTVTVRP